MATIRDLGQKLGLGMGLGLVLMLGLYQEDYIQ